MNISYLLYNLFHNRFSRSMWSLELAASQRKTKLRQCSITNTGRNNTISIGENGLLSGVRFFTSGDNNSIVIGRYAYCNGSEQQPICLNACDGTSITIGDNVLLSNNIEMHTTDYHKITDANNKVLNSPKDIVIGNRCWLGLRSVVLKGTVLPDDSIIGSCSLVNKAFTEKGTIIAGVPAKVVKTGVRIGDLHNCKREEKTSLER